MKLLFSMLLLMIAFSSNAQITVPIDGASKKFIVSQVVQTEGVSSDDLFIRARDWFSSTYKSDESILEITDKQAGIVVGSGYKDVTVSGYKVQMQHKVKVYVKDGRYKYEFTDFTFRSGMNTTSAEQAMLCKGCVKKNGQPLKYVQEYNDEILRVTSELATSLQQTLISKSKTDF